MFVKRNTIISVSIFSLVVITSIICFSTYNVVVRKLEIKNRLRTFNVKKLLEMDSTFFEPVIGKPLMIVLFHSTCDICQHLAKDIKLNYSIIKNYQIIMISSEPIPVIKSFSINTGLADISNNLTFAKIDEARMFDSFGERSYPCVLVYDHNFRQVLEFQAPQKVGPMISIIESVSVSKKY